MHKCHWQCTGHEEGREELSELRDTMDSRPKRVYLGGCHRTRRFRRRTRRGRTVRVPGPLHRGRRRTADAERRRQYQEMEVRKPTCWDRMKRSSDLEPKEYHSSGREGHVQVALQQLAGAVNRSKVLYCKITVNIIQPDCLNRSGFSLHCRDQTEGQY